MSSSADKSRYVLPQMAAVLALIVVGSACGTATTAEGGGGAAEHYQVAGMGSLIDERRIDGIVWARPLDGSRPWISARSSEAIDLGVLRNGQISSSTTTDHGQVIELGFTNHDVLRALSHIPSTGPTTATVTIAAGFVASIDLQFRGATSAHIELSDYGLPLAIDDPGLSSPSA